MAALRLLAPAGEIIAGPVKLIIWIGVAVEQTTRIIETDGLLF